MNNFFQKLGIGLKKSSAKISSGLNEIFNKRRLDSETLEELEELLISTDMGLIASGKIINNFAAKKLDKEISLPEIKTALAEDISNILLPCESTLEITSTSKPFVILMVGVNGAGKTTTIGKLADKLQSQGHKISFIAGDTFRAAAVEQLKVWADKLHIRIFTGDMGCDSAGLCYDGLNAAIKAGDDIVFIDTAGRLQNKNGLMDELKKIIRVIKKVIPDAPHKTLLTIDATTGSNALSQVEEFKQMCNVDGLIVTKLDGSSKGGMLVAIAVENPTPVHFIGIGEKTEDLDIFKADEYAKNLVGL